MTIPIPDHLKNLREISADEIRAMIEKGDVRIQRKTIRGEALVALHKAFFQGVQVHVEGSLIQGDLDFTQGPVVSLEEVEGLQKEIEERLRKWGCKGAVVVKGPIKIEESFIAGKVQSGFYLGMEKSVLFSKVSFLETTFGKEAGFFSAIFAMEADFSGTTFCKDALFWHANFGKEVFFSHATFSEGADFSDVAFGEDAYFWEATFGDVAEFNGAFFRGKAEFYGVTFGGRANYWVTTFCERALFLGATFRGGAVFRGLTETKGTEGEVIVEKNLVFNDEADFSMVTLKAPEEVRFQHVNLCRARFLDTPVHKVQFTDVEWAERDNRRCVYDEVGPRLLSEEKSYSLIAQLYRQLKKNYEEARDYPGAGDFHYGEMEMTLKQQWKDGKFLSWLLTRAYKFLSGYGEEPLWAIYILFWIWVLPAILAYMQPIMSTDPSPGFFGGLLDSLLVSIKAMSLRLPETPKPILGKFVMILQVFLGPIQIALTALALRRKFRR